MRNTLFRALIPLLIVSCAQPSGPVTDGVLEVEAKRPELHLTNRSRQPIYWAVFEADFATRMDWAPCLDPSRCTRLDPGQRRTLPYDAITGYSRSAEQVVIYGWRLVPDEGGFRVDSLRLLHARL